MTASGVRIHRTVATPVWPESEPSLRSDAESSNETSSDSESTSEFEADDRPWLFKSKLLKGYKTHI